MSQKAIEFAAQVNAKVCLPLDPKRVRDMLAKTDVTKTWDLYRPEVDFVTGKPLEQNSKRPWMRAVNRTDHD